MCVCVCVHMCMCWQALLDCGVKVRLRDAGSLCKYAEHDGPLAGAEGEHGVAELIYLMTERLISPQP